METAEKIQQQHSRSMFHADMKNKYSFNRHNYSPPLENSIVFNVFSCLQEKYAYCPGQHVYVFGVN